MIAQQPLNFGSRGMAERNEFVERMTLNLFKEATEADLNMKT